MTTQTKLLAELEKSRRQPEPPRATARGQEPLDPVPADPPDEWEEPAGDGRVTRQTALGVQLIDGRKLVAWIPYGGMLWGDGDFNGRRVRFDALRGDTLYEVVIEGEGEDFQKVADKLMDGKRLSVRVNGTSVTAITVRAVPQPPRA